MLNNQISKIKKILKDFTGTSGEPKDEKEFYILKSMWVMLCAEFEGCLRDLVEAHINILKKKKKVKDMHICFLLQNFYGDKKEELTIPKIVELFKRNKNKISFKNFTQNKKPTYKFFSVEKLFNTLGIFFSEKEIITLKLLDGIASTRDSISHGDHNITITRRQLEDNIPIMRNIYNMLKRKLKI